jgi:hypothetical protein
MRFSSAITFPLPQRMPLPVQARVQAQRPDFDEPPPRPQRELPADLDQRVRETGEW